MNLSRKVSFYILVIHLAVLLSAYFTFLSGNYWWLLVGACVCIASLVFSFWYSRRVLGTFELIRGGADFISERDFTTRIQPVGQKDVDHMVGVYNQMIDQLREERILFEEQNLFLHKLVEASPTGIIILELDGAISRMNPAAQRLMHATGVKLVEGRRLDELHSVFCAELSQLETGLSRVLTLGGRRKLKCHKEVFVDRGFRRQFILVEELTEELRQTEKAAYEKLIRLMSHEVNNTVASASSLLESCRSYASQLNNRDRAEFENALEVIITRTRDLNQFVRSFSEVVRIPAPNLSECDLKGLLEDVLFLMGSEMELRDIQCTLEVQGGPLSPVKMDRVQMEQVFVNVLKNAAEAIEEGGRIVLKLGRTEGLPYVIIEDTGRGIEPADKDKLFTPFFSTRADGHGLGLTLVREILENHRFDFSLEGSPDSGARFTILLR